MVRKERKYLVMDKYGFVYGNDAEGRWLGRIKPATLEDIIGAERILTHPKKGSGLYELVPVNENGDKRENDCR